MAIFKVVVSDPKTRKTFQTDLDQSKAVGLIGKKIGDEFSGDIMGLNDYSLQITGGTDKDGFPMHSDLKGSGRKKLLLTRPPGFHPGLKGQRKRKMVAGNIVGSDIVQINVKVVKYGDKKFEDFISKKEQPKPKEETPKEEIKQKEESKKEETKELDKKPDEKKKEEAPKEKEGE